LALLGACFLPRIFFAFFVCEAMFFSLFNAPEADKGLIPRRPGRYNVFLDTPLLRAGVAFIQKTTRNDLITPLE
jgi:hypothetical protein